MHTNCRSELLTNGEMIPADGREKIIAAVYSILIEESYDSVSIQHVADEAGLGKATIYHHFDDKSDLMLAFHEAAFSQLGKRLTQFGRVNGSRYLQTRADEAGVERHERWRHTRETRRSRPATVRRTTRMALDHRLKRLPFEEDEKNVMNVFHDVHRGLGLKD